MELKPLKQWMVTENIPRILDNSQGAKINLNALKVPDILKWLLFKSNISQAEALKTFNCGAGMVLVVKKNKVGEVQSILRGHGEASSIIGEITPNPGIEYIGKLKI